MLQCWTAYASLDKVIKLRARKAYCLWAKNPFHPSLHFKCINHEEDIWSVRITRGYRAIGIFDGDQRGFGSATTIITNAFFYSTIGHPS
jgi:hypothetical protein